MGSINPFRYRGYYYDGETNLYYLQTRYYDPEVGRFISADSIEYLDPETLGGLNLYAYCGNNPVMNVDPEGKAWWKWLLVALVVVAVAVTAVAAVATGGIAGAALMAVATGTAFGAIGGGVSAAINGTDISAGILGGAIKGAAIGLAIGLGIATGAGTLTMSTGLLAVGASTVVNMAAGMLSYAIDSSSNGREMNWKDAFASGGFQALSGVFAFLAGTIIGASGFYNMPKNLKMFSSKWWGNNAFGEFIKFITFRPFNYSFKYFKNQYLNGR